MNNSVIDCLQKLLNNVRGPVLVHSDMLKVGKLVDLKALGYDVRKICNQHAHFLSAAIADRNLIVPTFNYDFSQTRLFDVKNTPSQLGPFPEYFRCYCAGFRTAVPFFSFCSKDKIIVDENEVIIKPFGEKSVFDRLYKEDGCILYYGAPFCNGTTFIHYIENYYNGLIYRYNKIFYGRVIDLNIEYDVTVSFHVRPKNYHLYYNWEKMYFDLNHIGFINRLNTAGFENIFLIKAKDMFNFFTSKLDLDPFYLLDDETKEWVMPMYKRLGQKFLINDFE